MLIRVLGPVVDRLGLGSVGASEIGAGGAAAERIGVAQVLDEAMNAIDLALIRLTGQP